MKHMTLVNGWFAAATAEAAAAAGWLSNGRECSTWYCVCCGVELFL